MGPSTILVGSGFWRPTRNARHRQSPQPDPGGVQVADAPLTRQPADAKPAALAGEGRSSVASGKPALRRRRTEPIADFHTETLMEFQI